MSEPTITFGVNESGRIVYKATNDGVLLSKDEAERVASYISELKALARDLWFKNIGRMDSCGWCVIGCDDAEHCELQKRMAALGLLGGDAE